MTSMIFVNLPVSDLAVSRRYFTTLGYGFEERFCGEQALCMRLSDTIFVMLLRRDFFQTFTPRPVTDARQATEVLLCLSADSRAAVDALAAKAIASGGQEVREPMVQGDYMYARSIADLDGHIWELMWMDPDGMEGCSANAGAEGAASASQA